MEVVGTGFSAIEPRKSRAIDRRGALWSDSDTLANGTSRDKINCKYARGICGGAVPDETLRSISEAQFDEDEYLLYRQSISAIYI